MADLTNKWYQAIRISPDDPDEEDEDDPDADAISERSTTNIVFPGPSSRSTKS